MKWIILIPCIEMKSAGVRVLVYLNELMVELGHHCEINGCLEPEHIAVFPDVVRGNPLGASRIVRYMLYYPSAYYGGDRIAAQECPIIYHEMYYDAVCSHCDLPPSRENIIMLPTLNKDLFYPEEKTVESVLYIGKNHCSERPVGDMPVITRENMSRDKCIALLRRTKKLYTLDWHSAIATEADLCGCEVYLVKPGQVFEQFHCPDSERYVRNHERDLETVRKFASIALDFFNIRHTITA